jgi:hypothetical protein
MENAQLPSAPSAAVASLDASLLPSVAPSLVASLAPSPASSQRGDHGDREHDTAHAIMGRAGNNPYCHFRAREFARHGQRERLVRVAPAPGTPFDNGRFEIVVEPLDAPDARPARPLELVQIRRSPRSP